MTTSPLASLFSDAPGMILFTADRVATASQLAPRDIVKVYPLPKKVMARSF